MKRLLSIMVFISITCLAPSQKVTQGLQLNPLLEKKISYINTLITDKKFKFNPRQKLNLYEQFVSWSKQLSKSDLIKIIATQEQSELGFGKNDVLSKIKELQDKPFSEIYDTFMQYQQEFLFKDTVKQNSEDAADRLRRLHKEYESEQGGISYVRRLPFLHNLETKLLPDFTHVTDQALYEKIKKEMNRIGFSEEVINAEMNSLKNHNALQIQKDFPHLQNELANRLLYFNGTKQNSPEYVVKADHYLKVLHTWTTTAASIAAGGVSLLGLNPVVLQTISSSTLLNPYISQYQNFSKRQLLAMIYAQFKSYDALQDSYLDPKFKKIKFSTKSEILNTIQARLIELDITSSLIQKQMYKYQNLSKVELETIEEELEESSLKKQDLHLSENEKSILTLTRSDLLKEVEKYLPKNKDNKEKNIELLNKLKNENIYLVRTYLIDLMQSFDKKEKAPAVLSTKETMLHKSPKIVSDLLANHALEYIRHDWQTSQKSKIYQYWREKGLRKNLEQKRAGDVERHVMQTYESSNLIRSIIP